MIEKNKTVLMFDYNIHLGKVQYLAKVIDINEGKITIYQFSDLDKMPLILTTVCRLYNIDTIMVTVFGFNRAIGDMVNKTLNEDIDNMFKHIKYFEVKPTIINTNNM